MTFCIKNVILTFLLNYYIISDRLVLYFMMKMENWWYDGGTARFFFKDSKKHTGITKDENGRYILKENIKLVTLLFKNGLLKR